MGAQRETFGKQLLVWETERDENRDVAVQKEGNVNYRGL